MNIRIATLNDTEQIEQLIKLSVIELAKNDYTAAQIDSALKTAWGLDTQLIKDQTYVVIEMENQIIACGGWSYRKTLFGNNAEANRDASIIDNKAGAAKIRAFFVHPDYARKGLGSKIMHYCEEAAKQKGYTRLELMATLPGQRLYERHGFVAGKAEDYPLENDLTIVFVPMQKDLR